MKKAFLSILLLIAMNSFSQNRNWNTPTSIESPLVSNPEYKPGWILMFQDEFNGTAIDSTKWNKSENMHGNNPNTHLDYERQFNRAHGSNFEVSNGTLKIKAIKENYHGVWCDSWVNGQCTQINAFDYQYTSGFMESLKTYGYGYYEIKCKIPKGQSFWPAFWIFSNPWHEIDFYENADCGENGQFHVGTNFHVVNSVSGNCPDPTNGSFEIPVSQNLADNFYTIGVDWRENAMKWYVNNHLARAVFDPECELFVTNPGKIILNLAIEGWTRGSYLSSITFPGIFEIDYVRVYQKNNMEDSIRNNDPESRHYEIIFPNPNNGIFRVNSASEITSIQIFDQLGELILDKTYIKNNYIELNLSSVKNGIYISKIVGFGNEINTTKIVIFK